MPERPHGRKRNDKGQTAEVKKHGEALPKETPKQPQGILPNIKNFFQRKPH